MELQKACQELDINYNEILSRFGGNEAIYKRFLEKFLNDNTYYELEKSWEESDYSGIEKNAHTLKGLAGNLGMTRLYTISNDLVQKMRQKEYENTPEIYQKLKDEYKLAKNIIVDID